MGDNRVKDKTDSFLSSRKLRDEDEGGEVRWVVIGRRALRYILTLVGSPIGSSYQATIQHSTLKVKLTLTLNVECWMVPW